MTMPPCAPILRWSASSTITTEPGTQATPSFPDCTGFTLSRPRA